MPTSRQSEILATINMNKLQVPNLGKLKQIDSHLGTLFHTDELSCIKRIDGVRLVPHQPILLRDLNSAEFRARGFCSLEPEDIRDVINSNIHSYGTAAGPGARIMQKGANTNHHIVQDVVHKQQRLSSINSNETAKDDLESKYGCIKKSEVRKNGSTKLAFGTEKLSTLENIYTDRIIKTLPVKSSKMSRQNKRKMDAATKDQVNAFSSLIKGVNLQGNNIKIQTEHVTNFSTHHSKPWLLKKTEDVENFNSSEVSFQSQRHKSTQSNKGLKTTKVFLSEKQSGFISDCGMSVPCAPPTTPTPEQLMKTEYVPSLQDIKAQRLVRQRLQTIEEQKSRKERKKLDSQNLGNQKTLVEMKQDLKKMQRREIYALNKVMKDLEYDNFQQFMYTHNEL